MENNLPTKPSDILSVALADFRAVKESSHYSVDMNHWHTANDAADVCRVCLAGSVMARSLAVFHHETITCMDFDRSNEQKLRFLDNIREGVLSDYGRQFASNISENMANQLALSIEELYDRHNKEAPSELGYSEVGEVFEDYLKEATQLLKRFGT